MNKMGQILKIVFLKIFLTFAKSLCFLLY